MITFLVCTFVAQSSFPGGLSSIPASALTNGFSQYFDYIPARNGVRHNVEAQVSEDGTCIWVRAMGGGNLFAAAPAGWHQFDLPSGSTRERQLYFFTFLPLSKRVVGYNLSQSKDVSVTIEKERLRLPASERAKWRLTKDTSTILAVLSGTKLVTATEGVAWDPAGDGAKTLMACALITSTARGGNPNRSAFLAGAKLDVGRSIGSSYNNGILRFVQFAESSASVLSYDTISNRLQVLTKPSKAIPVSAEPKLYDFVSRRVFYDFATIADKSSRTWREYSLDGRKWLRFAPPKGDPRAVFYSNGRLYAGSRLDNKAEHLFVADQDRRNWRDIGPYVVHARSLSGKWWVVQRSTDRKLFLANMMR